MREKLDALVAWVRANGGTATGFEVREVAPGERACFAHRAIDAQEMLLSIPRRLLRTNADAERSEAGRRFQASELSLISPHSLFAAELLMERTRSDSFWAPVFKTLPSAFDSMPLFWSESELELLRDTTLAEDAQRQRECLSQDYEALRDARPELQAFTLQNFLWAHAVSTSRTFRITQPDEEENSAMVPLLDMLNHSSSPNVAWRFNPEQSAFEACAARAIAAGEEVVLSYGEKSNRRLLLSFGFTLDEPPRHDAILHASVTEGVPRAGFKRLLLLGRDDAALTRKYVFRGEVTNEGVSELMSFLRFSYANNEETSRLLNARTNLTAVPFLSAENEALALRRVEHLAVEHLAKLKAPDSRAQTLNARNVAMVLRGERFVLERLRDWARAGLSSLPSTAASA